MHQKPTTRLSKKKRYLQLAFNSTLGDAANIIATLPISDRIIIEAGTPLIKQEGMRSVSSLFAFYADRLRNAQNTSEAPIIPYIVADMKTMDRGRTEVAMAANAGASGVIALGSAPTETLNAFIAACHEYGVDPMIDMMNVEYPLTVLRALKTQPRVVVLHRGVDEERDNKTKMLPLHEIRRVKGAYDTMIAVAGGDTPREIQSAAFNDADIVVVWKSVYAQNEKTLEVVEGFLKTIK